MTKQDELQEKVILKMIDFYKDNTAGYLDLAMRFGKTRTVIEYLNRSYKVKPSILIAYPDNKLKQVWEDEFQKWGYMNPDIKYCNFSSLSKHTNSTYSVFVIDEFHDLSENQVNLAKEIMESSFKTIALSGTINLETKEKWPELTEIAKYSTLDGIKDGILSDYRVTVHLVNLDTKITSENSKGVPKTEKQKYDALTWVIQKLRRQGSPTMHLALSRNRLSLSSIGKITFVKSMLSGMKTKRVLIFTGLANVADSLEIPSYHSKSENDFAFHAFQNQHINHLALAAMGKVGVTYPALDSVILLNFTYNAAESAQILNRAIKLDYHGKIADLHIICLNEDAELNKVKESLSMLDKNKIKYL